MNLEETKKIIENKIEAEALTHNVRYQIKSYIDQKQNVREGFKETFQPLIESQEAVKASIDKEQNAMIKQLQENQLALTEGLDENRLAITQGFDKMDEVKRFDLLQLPSYEAVEEPEKESEEEESEEEETKEDIIENIKYLQNLVIKKHDLVTKLIAESKAKYEDGNIKDANKLLKEVENQNENIEILQRKMKRLYQSLGEETEEESVKKPIITTVTYGKDEMDKHLNKKETVDILKSYGLELPSVYKDKSMEEFQEAFDKGMDETAKLKNSIKNVAYYEKDSDTGLILAFPSSEENATPNSKKPIKKYNIMQIFINNMGQLRNYKKLTGTGIFHFNNPLQLLDRLELLAGSIFAGNNGVKQEFSQIAHLLHQLKVITKKQLNDLLKKYILKK